jgi:RNA polymerase sigma factor (sigma-70 family)
METLQTNIGLFTDDELIRKIIEGETALFEVLIRRYNPLLYKIARSYGMNHQDAEDMMQETHFSAYTGLKTFRYDASYKTWLTKIMLHKCYHKLNYGNHKYEQPNSELFNDNIPDMYEASDKNGTEKIISNKELASVLEQSLLQIPFTYRTVFILREAEGFSVSEAASLLNITPTNVKVRLNRAKAMLKKQLEKYYTSAEIFEFHQKYCDGIVENVFLKIKKGQA